MQGPGHIAAAAAAFAPEGTPVSVARHGAGLINETWLCEYASSGGAVRYLLQRINAAVFPRPEEVLENVAAVTAHIRARLAREGRTHPAEDAPELVPAKDGRSFHRDAAGAYWRMFRFIERAAASDTVSGPAHAREIGRALGRFQSLVADLDPSRLHDTLPGFHHTPKYLEDLRRAAGADRCGRSGEARDELAFAEQRRELAPLLVRPMEEGGIPVRVVHNDPKVNNVLVHRETGRAVCMIDLDTVKPGIVHFDFGDCVRSAANPAGEDADPERVAFDRSCYEAVRDGYLGEASSFLTAGERDLLPLSARVITFELGIRFLADHLRGDTYFRIQYPGHNLHRARAQFRLLERMEEAGI